jgi:hypothetical protein
MSDPSWISAAKAHHSHPILSKSRTDFGVEAGSRSPYFCLAVSLCELDDDILRDIGLTRDALLRETTRPF